MATKEKDKKLKTRDYDRGVAAEFDAQSVLREAQDKGIISSNCGEITAETAEAERKEQLLKKTLVTLNVALGEYKEAGKIITERKAKK